MKNNNTDFVDYLMEGPSFEGLDLTRDSGPFIGTNLPEELLKRLIECLRYGYDGPEKTDVELINENIIPIITYWIEDQEGEKKFSENYEEIPDAETFKLISIPTDLYEDFMKAHSSFEESGEDCLIRILKIPRIHVF